MAEAQKTRKPRGSEPNAGALRRRIPATGQALQDPALRGALRAHGRVAVLRELRRALSEVRALAVAGDDAGFGAIVDRLGDVVTARLGRQAVPSLLRVINATGVVVHTNLGRSPLSKRAAARVAEVAASYSNLEWDLASGQRGDREAHAEWRLRELLGVEATAVVNNGAAAVLLAVNTLAEGREVLVSRGELVEIGGSFRIPDVVGKAGARLREVGTTNRTRIEDFEAAAGPGAALVLKVHPSNFRIVGFTETPGRKELAAFAARAGLPLVEDQGSGLLRAMDRLGSESTVEEALAAGTDVVVFSGDKLLGGPQSGLLAGRARYVDTMRKNPLYRALRVDKMALAALDAVLLEHAEGRQLESVPALRMLNATVEEVRTRALPFAQALRDGLRGRALRGEVTVLEGSSAVGGGAAPVLELPTVLVAVRHPAVEAGHIAERLRLGETPVAARVAEAQVLLDLRTVAAEEEAALLDALLEALAQPD
jgi:L-seryl-tRNA(Ser) seleniumtransferase